MPSLPDFPSPLTIPPIPFTPSPYSLLSSTLPLYSLPPSPLLTPRNSSDEDLKGITFRDLPSDLRIQGLDPVPLLRAGQRAQLSAHIDFKGEVAPIALTLHVASTGRSAKTSLRPEAGDLLQPLSLTNDLFESQTKLLGGMYCNAATLTPREGVNIMKDDEIVKTIQSVANIGYLGNTNPDDTSSGTLRFAARTLAHDDNAALVTVARPKDKPDCILVKV